MTKPIDETWVADDWNVETDEQKQIFTCPRPYWDDTPTAELKARARLAAQAPAMAKLLLKLSRRLNGLDDIECAACGIYEPNHTDDCELVAVLMAAGVLGAKP